MSIWRSARSTRVLVTLLAVAGGVVAFYQAIALSNLDSEFPLGASVGYAPLLLGVYGGAIALFFAWRPQQRQVGDMAGLFLALFALNLSLSVVPSQAAPPWQLAAYSVTMLYYVAGLRFTMLFPREISQQDLRGHQGHGGSRTLSRRVGDAILRLQERLVLRPKLLWAFAPVFVSLWSLRTVYEAAMKPRRTICLSRHRRAARRCSGSPFSS